MLHLLFLLKSYFFSLQLFLNPVTYNIDIILQFSLRIIFLYLYIWKVTSDWVGTDSTSGYGYYRNSIIMWLTRIQIPFVHLCRLELEFEIEFLHGFGLDTTPSAFTLFIPLSINYYIFCYFDKTSNTLNLSFHSIMLIL